MGRGRSKQKVQQAFLQRKWPLGGYLTLWEKEEMRTIHCKGGWPQPPRTARGPVGTTIAGLGASLDLAAGLGQKRSGGTTPVPSITEWNWSTGKSVSVSSFPEGQRISTRSILAGCSTRNVNEVRSATNNCRRCGPRHFAPFPLRLP